MVPEALWVLRHGLLSLRQEGKDCVYLPLTSEPNEDYVRNGYIEEVELCLHLSEDFFRRYVDTFPTRPGEEPHYIPCSELAALGPPQLYDHHFSGKSRHQLVGMKRAIRALRRRKGIVRIPAKDLREVMDCTRVDGCDSMRETLGFIRENVDRMIRFLDEVGWASAVRLHQQGQAGPLA